MHRYLFPILVVLFLAFFLLWDPLFSALGVKQIMPWELAKRVGDGTAPALLDMRTRAEYEAARIPGAVLAADVPGGAQAFAARVAGPELVLICFTGHRSTQGILALGETRGTEGQTLEIRNLSLGMVGYVLAGGETVWWWEGE